MKLYNIYKKIIKENIEYTTVYRGQPAEFNTDTPTYYIWVTEDKDFAKEYGSIKTYLMPNNLNILDTDYYDEFEALVDEFTGEEHSEEGELEYDDYKYQPGVEFIEFLKSKGYDGFQNGDNILIFNYRNLLKTNNRITESYTTDRLALKEKLNIAYQKNKQEFINTIIPFTPNIYKLQDDGPERLLEKQFEGEGGNYWKYKIENAGDVIRELAKYKNEFVDPGYIFEKINKIEKFLEDQRKGVHPDDRYYSIKQHNNEKLEAFNSAYQSLPVMSDAQENARQLVLSIINGDLNMAQKYIDYFNGLRNKEALMQANSYIPKLSYLYYKNQYPELKKAIDEVISDI